MCNKLFQQKRGAYCHKGFTLIETFVAIAVLISAVAATLTVVEKSLVLTGVARNRAIAFYLVQEALELVHNERDTIRLAAIGSGKFPVNAPDFDPDYWLSSLSGACAPPNGCMFDARFAAYQGGVAPCAGGVCLPLRFEASSGFYGYGATIGNPPPLVPPFGWEDTIFTRRVVITTPPVPTASPAEANITVEVTWSDRNTPKKIISKENLFNWK